MKRDGRRGERPDLRQLAEEKVRAEPSAATPTEPPQDALRLIHELQVHQVELEMQNEELRRARDELEATSARYSELYDFAPVGYVTLDREGAILKINLVGAAMLGEERASLVGRRLTAWVTPATRPALEGLLGDLRQAERASTQLGLRGAEGPRRVRVDAVPESNSAAEWRCRVALTDVTEEQQLRERIEEAQKLESVGRLAGGVAHDFNNLLTAILGGAGAMREAVDAGAPVEREDLDAIQAAAERARELTRQLLAVARRQVFAPVRLDLGALAVEAEKLLRRRLPGSILLTTRLQQGLWPVLCDAAQLQQVVMNLAVNARDAMPAGGRLSIETANVDLDQAAAIAAGAPRPGSYVRLTVRDTGTGLAPEARAHLYEPFFTTKAIGRGTGLGLATVYGIVKQSGGCLAVESATGQGTAFHVYLPRALGPEVPAAGASPVPTVRQGDGETVLVVEDEPLVLAVAVRVLRKGGFRVLVAASGREALEVEATGVPIDLLLTDVVMPGLGGRELAARLVARRPGLRVLFVSGYPQLDAGAGAGPEAIPGDLLPKPYTAASLLERVRAALAAPRPAPRG